MFTVRLEGVKELQEKLNPERFKKAIIRSLYRAGKSGRQVALDEIRRRYNIKESDLRKEISIELHPSELEVIISAKSGHISLFKFSPKVILETINRKSGALYSRLGRAKVGRKVAAVSVSIIRGTRKRVKGGFIARTHRGELTIFKRVGSKRLPIEKIATIGVGGMFGSSRIMNRVIDKVKESWRKNFLHELKEGWKFQK